MDREPSTTITLSIREAGPEGRGALSFQMAVDGEAVAPGRDLSAAQSRGLREFSAAYSALFERDHEPRVAEENLRALGSSMFDLWLGESWGRITSRVPSGSQRLLVIASDLPHVLNLPWELLLPPGGDFVGLDPLFSVRRLPWTDRPLAPAAGPLPPRPLRILFMACAPLDQPDLDYEREEEALLKAVSRPGTNVVLDSLDMGSFEELRQRINEFRPHVVHLSGHGIVAPDGQGCFAFEDERGGTHLRPSAEIRQGLFAGSGVQCAFISGCQSAKAPPVAALGGICQGLVGAEVPLAIGWAASIRDPDATKFAAIFYNTLASGRPVDRALVQARQAMREEGRPAWTLPVLYASTRQGLVFDPDPSRPVEVPTRRSVVQQPLPGMTEGHAEHFVGRRREMQRLLPALREGKLQSVLITGLGGAGKSTLATRLARKLEADGFVPIPVPSSRERPLGAARLLEACGDAFLKARRDEDYQRLHNPQLPIDARLRYIVSVLNEGRFVLVLDNFEVNLEESSRRTLDPEVAGLYSHLMEHLSGASRCIITSRYPPADVAALPPTVREEPLGDFPPASFLKFLTRDPVVEGRYREGELPLELLAEVRRLLGATPRFLTQVRQVLRTISAEELARQLKAVRVPGEGPPAELQEARDRYCEGIFTARLYAELGTNSRRALSRAAVYGVAVNMEGLAAVSGEPANRVKPFAREWQERALAYPEPGPAGDELWTVYGLLRGWLLAPERLDPEERRVAHRAAGDFLRGLEGEDREGELGLGWVDCLLEARAQYLAAGAWGPAREVTYWISDALVRHGDYPQVIGLNQELLEHEEHPQPMNWIGWAYRDLADYARARSWYEAALKVAGDVYPKEAGAAWFGLATIDLSKGDYKAGGEKFLRSLKIRQETGDRAGEAAALHQLATIDLEKGDYKAAREKLLRSLKIRQEIDNLAGEAAAWHQLATIDLLEGNYQAAREKFLRSLKINQEIDGRAGEAATWHQLATIDLREGDHKAAREKILRSLKIRQGIGDRAGEAGIWHQLASIDLEEGDYKAAREKFLKALEIERETGNRAGEAATWHGLAAIDLKKGDYNAAREEFLRSLKINQEIGGRPGEAMTFHELGALAVKQGHVAESIYLVALCCVIERSIGGDTEPAFRNLQDIAAECHYSDKQLEAMLREVEESYRRDRGWGFIKAAFRDA